MATWNLGIQNLPGLDPSGKHTYIAIEHGPVEIVSFPIKHGGSFHRFLYVYQAGSGRNFILTAWESDWDSAPGLEFLP